MLFRLGFSVLEAGSVIEALSLCEQSHPDLVVVDWNLPDEDGVALVQQPRRLPGGEKMKLIMCTVERSVADRLFADARLPCQLPERAFATLSLHAQLGGIPGRPHERTGRSIAG